MKRCRDCKHCRPQDPWWVLWIPIIGWFIFLFTLSLDWRWVYATCRVSPKKELTGEVGQLNFCSISRSYGPCWPDAKLFEAR